MFVSDKEGNTRQRTGLQKQAVGGHDEYHTLNRLK